MKGQQRGGVQVVRRDAEQKSTADEAEEAAANIEKQITDKTIEASMRSISAGITGSYAAATSSLRILVEMVLVEDCRWETK